MSVGWNARAGTEFEQEHQTDDDHHQVQLRHREHHDKMRLRQVQLFFALKCHIHIRFRLLLCIGFSSGDCSCGKLKALSMDNFFSCQPLTILNFHNSSFLNRVLNDLRIWRQVVRHPREMHNNKTNTLTSLIRVVIFGFCSLFVTGSSFFIVSRRAPAPKEENII